MTKDVAPTAEPVAWMVRRKKPHFDDWVWSDWYPAPFDPPRGHGYEFESYPLYAHPPTLSEEFIQEALRLADDLVACQFTDDHDKARAALEAHLKE